MAVVGRIPGWQIIVKGSGSEPNPLGGRREHGPPHFVIKSKEKEYRIKIPRFIMSHVREFEFLDEKPDSQTLKLLFRWMMDSETTQTLQGQVKIPDFLILVSQWNKENPNMRIKILREEDKHSPNYQQIKKLVWLNRGKWQDL